MVEAFRTLGTVPDRDRARLRGFPSYAPFLADPQVRAMQGEGGRRRRATASELSRLERALDWPLRYLKNDELARQCFLAWAYAKLRNGSIEWLLARHGMSREEFDRHRRRAAMTIAAGLARDGVAIE